ncbi:MAG: deoxyguanosinetriphosphate triphosphohydrolase [bacterium]|nr:deoxyguanosinetriphosphate triphosphohydrolase [bacterium]
MMKQRLVREIVEELEASVLSPYAILSTKSMGRQREEEPCCIRTAFQRDRDRIIHSHAFRQLKYKTQVFLIPSGESIRTRLTHTIEVSQIARTISRALRLNEDLTEAIALGHDLGHPAFGHTGELALAPLTSFGFKHNEQSLRVVDLLEKDGSGLNLTQEVRDGILKHSLGDDDFSRIGNIGKAGPITLEGVVVLFADKIAYINHDIQDAETAGLISVDELPENAINLLGRKSSERIDTMVQAMVTESIGKNKVEMRKDVLEASSILRKYLYENLYRHPRIQKESEKAKRVMEELFYYYTRIPDEPKRRLSFLSHEIPIERIVIDHLASLSDREALSSYKKVFFPMPWKEEG